MAYMTEAIALRIAWCQQQKSKADAPLDVEEWQEEEEGLQDVLLHRDHTNQYQFCPPAVLERYVRGLQDGLALIRAAAVAHYHATSRS